MPSTPLAWNLEITSALGGRMMSLSHEATCLVPQVRTFFDLPGEGGTFTPSGDPPSLIRLVPWYQAFDPTAGGERGAPNREENGVEIPRSLGDVRGEEGSFDGPLLGTVEDID